MSKALWISPQRVTRNSLIDGDIDHNKLVPHIEGAQDMDVFNLLGQPLFERIDDLIANKDNNDATSINHASNADYKDLVVNPEYGVRPMLEQYAVARFLRYARYTINDKGVFVHTATNATAAEKEETDALIQDVREKAEMYANNLYNYICFNTRRFPEYVSITSTKTPPSNEPFDYGFLSF